MNRICVTLSFIRCKILSIPFCSFKWVCCKDLTSLLPTERKLKPRGKWIKMKNKLCMQNYLLSATLGKNKMTIFYIVLK